MSVSGYSANHPAGKAAAIRMRRFVNDEIARMGVASASTGRFEFVCECGDLRCKRLVGMTLAEYASIAPGSVVSCPLSQATIHAESQLSSKRSRRDLDAHSLVQRWLVGEAVADAAYVILVADEQMRFAAASDAATELLGYEPDALLKLSVPDIVVERHEAPGLFREFMAIGEQRGRITLRCRNGELIDAVYFAHETTMSGLPYFVSALFPITTEITESDMLEDLFARRSAAGHD